MTDQFSNQSRRYDVPFQDKAPTQYPDNFGPPNQVNDVNQPLMHEIYVGPYDPRPKNFPPCKPIIHHDISKDISMQFRHVVRQAYFGWYIHALCLLYNFVCLFGQVVKEATIAPFFYSLLALLFGLPISFWVYWLFYSAIRKNSSFNFCLWFVLFVGQIAAEVFYTVGIKSYGAAGFASMLDNFSGNYMILGIMFAVSTFMWAGIALYNMWFFNQARRTYNDLGGNEQAKQQFTQAAVQTAVDNRETIIQVAKDNKDTIKTIAVENKDTIYEFAKDNKQEIGRAVVNNSDTIYENKAAIATVFGETPKNSSSHV